MNISSVTLDAVSHIWQLCCTNWMSTYVGGGNEKKFER